MRKEVYIMKTESKAAILVRQLCATAHVSQAELARRLNTTPQNLYKRLQYGHLSIEEYQAISNALQLPITIALQPLPLIEQ